MHPTDRAARIAGAVYLSLALTVPFALLYVPRTLIVLGDATVTAHNILAHETLFRFGIVAELLTQITFILLVLALHRLLGGVNKTYASLMVMLVLISAAVGFVGVLNNLAALSLFRGSEVLGVFDRHQLDALAILFLGLHSQANVVNEILWGLWLFPFGVLVMKSGFLPRTIGVLLVANCLAYLAISLTSLLVPQYASVVSKVALLPMSAGELSIVAWLLIKGAQVPTVAGAY